MNFENPLYFWACSVTSQPQGVFVGDLKLFFFLSPLSAQFTTSVVLLVAKYGSYDGWTVLHYANRNMYVVETKKTKG